MSTEAKFRRALEVVGTAPCTCASAGTCAACVAIKALMPDHLSVTEDQSVTVTLESPEDEPSTILQLARLDKRFPLIADNPEQATQEIMLRMLDVLIHTVKDLPSFAIAVQTTGFHIDTKRE